MSGGAVVMSAFGTARDDLLSLIGVELKAEN
jgi:hypothetical protein